MPKELASCTIHQDAWNLGGNDDLRDMQTDYLKSGLSKNGRTYDQHLENICMNGVAADTRDWKF